MRPLLLALLALAACVLAASAATDLYSRSFSSFSALRLAQPSAAGELVYLTSHVAGKYKGGGMFIGSLTAAADDGGMTASNGTAYHWTRAVEDYETLNVLHFGAYHDGTTDDHDAVMAMWKWSISQTDDRARNGIRLVEGAIYLSAFDISDSNVTDFAVYGPTTPYGVRPLVTITSDKSTTPAFKVCAQNVVLRGLGWNGQVTGTVDSLRVPLTQSNYQSFIQNIYVGNSGQTVNVFGFQGTATGKHVFDFLNLVQSKFDQIYHSYCYGNVWNIGWSGADGSYWDHTRSIEISNINIQYSYGVPGALNLPRVEDGTLRNIWIEHSRSPGDISSGQWIIDALNIESTFGALYMNGTRDITRQLSLQSGASILRGTDIDSWLSDSDMGWMRQDPYGIQANAPVASLWEASMLRGSNTGNASVWLSIGTFQTQALGGMWEIEILSKIGNDVASGVRPTNNGAPGVTRIMMQRGASTVPVVTFTNEGSTGISAVRYNGNYVSYTTLWVQVAANVLEYGVFIRGTGITRFYAGTWNMYSLSGATQTATPSGSTVVPGKTSLHNGVAGIGAEGSVITIDTVTVDPTEVNVTAIAGFMIQKLNGVDYAIPYYSAPEEFPQDPPTGVPPTAPAPSAASALIFPAVALLSALLLSALAVL